MVAVKVRRTAVAGDRLAAVVMNLPTCCSSAARGASLEGAARPCSGATTPPRPAATSQARRGRGPQLGSDGAAEACGRFAAFDEYLTSSVTLEGSWNGWNAQPERRRSHGDLGDALGRIWCGTEAKR